MPMIKLYPHQGQALEQTKTFNRVAYYLDMGLGHLLGSEKMCDLGFNVNLLFLRNPKLMTWIQHFKHMHSMKNRL